MSIRRRRGNRHLRMVAALGLASFAAMMWAAQPAPAAKPQIIFTPAPSGANEGQLRGYTPAEGATVKGTWSIRVEARADQGGPPAAVKRVTAVVIPVGGARGDPYADGEPLLDETYRCPPVSDTATPGPVSAAIPWVTDDSINGVYRIIVRAESCSPADRPTELTRTPVSVENPAEPPSDVAVTELADGKGVRVTWAATPPKDSLGYRVIRLGGDGTATTVTTTASAATGIGDRPPPGTWSYSVIALRQSAKSVQPLASDPVQASGSVTIGGPTTTATASPGEGDPQRPGRPESATDAAGGDGLGGPGIAGGGSAGPRLGLPSPDRAVLTDSAATTDTVAVDEPAITYATTPNTDPGSFREGLPLRPGSTIVEVPVSGPLENGVAGPGGRDSIYAAEVRRRLSAGEVIGGRIELLGVGVGLLAVAIHMGAFVNRARVLADAGANQAPLAVGGGSRSGDGVGRREEVLVRPPREPLRVRLAERSANLRARSTGG